MATGHAVTARDSPCAHQKRVAIAVEILEIVDGGIVARENIDIGIPCWESKVMRLQIEKDKAKFSQHCTADGVAGGQRQDSVVHWTRDTATCAIEPIKVTNGRTGRRPPRGQQRPTLLVQRRPSRRPDSSGTIYHAPDNRKCVCARNQAKAQSIELLRSIATR